MRSRVLSYPLLLSALLLARPATTKPSPPSAYHASDQYLEEYGTLYDHLGMLSDHERMRAYHDSIRLNAAAHFKGKVVLDVGTGTGVLAIWAAQAGAGRVSVFTLAGAAAELAWEDELLRLPLEEGGPRPAKLRVELWDADWQAGEDGPGPLATAEVELPADAETGEVTELAQIGRAHV